MTKILMHMTIQRIMTNMITLATITTHMIGSRRKMTITQTEYKDLEETHLATATIIIGQALMHIQTLDTILSITFGVRALPLVMAVRTMEDHTERILLGDHTIHTSDIILG